MSWEKKVFYDFTICQAEASKFVSHDASEDEHYIDDWRRHDLEELGLKHGEGFKVKITVEKIK